MAAAVTVATLSTLPQFLLGALAPLLVEDLGISIGGVAGAIFALNAVAILVSPLVGRLIDIVGPRWSALAGLVITSLGLSLMGLTPTVFDQLWMSAAILGIPLAIAQPVTNGMLVADLPPSRRGLAFGLKQAATPLAGLMAGIAVPVAVEVADWRVCLFAAALLSLGGTPLVVAVLGPRRKPEVPSGPAVRAPTMRPLVFVTVAATLASAGYVASSTFMVTLAVSHGHTVAMAGVILAIASVAAIVSRVWLGRLADRLGGDALLLTSVTMLAGGVCLAVVRESYGALFVVMAAAVGATAWAWNGTLHLAVATSYSARPASATGMVQMGIFLGAGLGPWIFAQGLGYVAIGTAWLAASGILLVAGCATFWLRRLV